MRTDRVWLAADEPRCEPSRRHDWCSRCARHLAPVPVGGIMGDYSLSLTANAVICPHFASVKQRVLTVAEREVKPWPVGLGAAHG